MLGAVALHVSSVLKAKQQLNLLPLRAFCSPLEQAK